MVTLSVIVPVYNEERTIREIIGKVKAVDLGGITKELIVVDDCSTDGTRTILEKIEGIKLFTHSENIGKGAAVRTGIKQATGDIVIIQDADLEYNPNEYSIVLKPIIDGRAKVVYGSRFLDRKHKPKYVINYLGLKFLALLVRVLYGKNVSDLESCYKAFTADVIKSIKLEAKRFDFEPEVTAKLIKRGHEIFEVPISYVGRGYEDGKKIRMRDGFQAIFCLVKYRFFD